MYWWDRAAERLTEKGTRLKRFGFVTTNSITQEFSRRVMAARMDARAPISLVMAIPDHPWTKATKDAAAVRIAMTVAEATTREGTLLEVTHESGLNSDAPNIDTERRTGKINADLTLGADTGTTWALKANDKLCSNGMKPLGAGFLVSKTVAEQLGLGKRATADSYIRSYRNGRDLTSRSREMYALDMFGLSADEVRRQFPEVYQHLLVNVRPEREAAAARSTTKDAQEYADKWWLFCKPRQEMRSFLTGLPRYIVTVQTAKHRVFQFLPNAIMPDQKLMVFGLEETWLLGVLSSHAHAACLTRLEVCLRTDQST
jgi:hypothetical protein